ncbi:MAG: universal stress protein [Saprospiraceae bacterium]|nr:universal stress protein [Bacteroidia bacterium]NNE14701.1 universal stress protein [Saprospiraceae bacterium]NNL91015.1 universal stress protein [Saprospiraceae bacterium]
MKILCALDFSKTSLNAARWTNNFLADMGGGEITFIHCMGIQHRAVSFNPMEDILKDNAEEDIKNLIEEIRLLSNTYKYKIVKGDPKTYITEYASRMKADWLATGSKGLTALKDMTVGSVTEYFIKYSHRPVITIPLEAKYNKIKTIVLGMDHKIIENEEILKPVRSITNVTDAKLKLLHINTSKDDMIKFDPTFEIYFSDINYETEIIPKTGSISELLNNYCDEVNADLLVMIHHKRNWLQELFSKSISKQELFDFEIPLFILPE